VSSSPLRLDEARVFAYWTGYGAPIALVVEQLTTEGGLLRSRVLWEMGEEVRLELWFPQDTRYPVRVAVGVPSQDPPGMNFRFASLDEKARSALARYLARVKQEE
jgi:hypothetical protein